MFDRTDFVGCIASKLGRGGVNGRKGASDARLKEYIADFDIKSKYYKDEGHPEYQAYSLAMGDVLRGAYQAATDRANKLTKNIQVIAEAQSRIAEAENIKTGIGALWGQGKGPGHSIARGLIALLVDDPRIPRLNVEDRQYYYRGRWTSLMANTVDKYGHGLAGRRRGAADERDIVIELFAPFTKRSSGNENAKAYAEGARQMFDIIHNDFNAAGGKLPYRTDFVLPQNDSPVKTANMTFDQYKKLKDETVDWDKMRHPDGSKIQSWEHDKVLKYTFETTKSDGANRVDDSTLRGTGRALGDMSEHRFFVYKDADAWLKNNRALGNGTAFDLVDRYIHDMSHRTAMIETFGRNPELMMNHIKAMGKKRTGEITAAADPHTKEVKAKTQYDSEMRTYDKLGELSLRQNSLDPENGLAAGVILTHDVLMSAQLGGMVLTAMPGDFATSTMSKLAGNRGLITNMAGYLHDFAAGNEAEQIAAQTGHIFGTTAMGHYSTQRFSGLGTYGPAIGRRLSSLTMAITGANRHTNIGRWVPQKELMGAMYRTLATPFDEHDLRFIMARYGIDASDWDAFRKNITPRQMDNMGKVFFAVPIDFMNSKYGSYDARLQISQKFNTMLRREAQLAVPDASTEASVGLRLTTRPDTLPGVILYSFGMYKNFPLTLFMQYGRLAMTLSPTRRLAFLAGLGAMLTIGGALTVQMKNLVQGKNPQPMDDWRFWGKGAMVGGAMGVWGDFLFSGMSGAGRGPIETAAGPLVSFAADLAHLAFDDPFAIVEAYETGKRWEAKTPKNLARFLRYYTPGSNVWYARLALERYIWDALDRYADPRAVRKQNAQVRKYSREYGGTYWFPPGQ